MDFRSLNRRELQYLCKLNKIPANITNISMADALKSLETVIGIEEFLNNSSSETAESSIESPKKTEFLSPRIPRTNCRTATSKKVKKSETESCKTTVKLETTVQRVYNTRRSTRLTEKKCTETGVTKREISQPVKIASFLEEVSVISEKNVESGFSTVETSNESNISFDNMKDSVVEETDENCDEGVSKAKVEDICIEFEKLGVVTADVTDDISVIEKVDCCDENVDLEDKQEVEELGTFEDKTVIVDIIKQDSEVISDPCQDDDSEKILIVVDEKINDVSLTPDEQSEIFIFEEVFSSGSKVDCCDEYVELEDNQINAEKFNLNEVEKSEVKNDEMETIKSYSENISNSFENVVPQEHFDILPCDKVLSETDGSNVDSVFCKIENLSDHLESDLDLKNGIDLHGALNVSIKEHNVNLALEDKANDADSNFCDTENQSDFQRSALKMNNEFLDCNGYINKNEITAKPERINENISTNTVDEVLKNGNEQNPNEDFENPEDAQESLIKETGFDMSDNNENKDDNINDKKVDQQKAISLDELSLRQLKKQLKALSIKSNMNTNKDDMVAETRPVLQVVCDNRQQE